MLIKHGVDINALDTSNVGSTAIFTALLNDNPNCDNLSLGDLLFNLGADLNIQDSKGYSILHYTSVLQKKEILVFLLRNGANIHLTSKDGKTPLNIAHETIKPILENQMLLNLYFKNSVYQNNYKKANELLDPVNSLIPQLNQIFHTGKSLLNTVLELHAENGDMLKMIQLIIQHGVFTSFKTPNIQTPLHIAVSTNQSDTTSLIINTMINRSESLNSLDSHGLTALHYAAQNNDTNLFKELVNSGANLTIQVPHSNGYTPVHKAVVNSNIEMLNFALSYGIDINLMDKFNRTLLFAGISSGDLFILQYLMNKGANLYSKATYNKSEISVLYDSLTSGYFPIFEFLLNNGMKNLSLDFHGYYEDKNILEHCLKTSRYNPSKYLPFLNLLLKKESLSNDISSIVADKKFNRTWLYLVAKLGFYNSVNILLEQNSSTQYLDYKNSTPLLYALSHSQENCSQLILDYMILRNETINHENSKQFTALHYAASKGYYSIVQTLLHHHASTDFNHSSLDSPLIMSIKNNHIKTAMLIAYTMFQKGEPLYTRNNDGFSALDYSIEKQKSHPSFSHLSDYLSKCEAIAQFYIYLYGFIFLGFMRVMEYFYFQNPEE